MLRDAEFTEDEILEALNGLYSQNKVLVRNDAQNEIVYEYVEPR